MSQPLADNIALVTGGATGIGRAVAIKLAQLGAVTAIVGRRHDKLQEAVEFAGASGTRLHARSVDVADRGQVAELFDWMRADLGAVSILVNAAGTNIPNRMLSEMSPEQWDTILAVNATGAYNTIHQAAPDMRSQGDGLIVNISSISGKRALALGGLAYCASKFAMTALGVAAGNELNADGVRVTNVYPGEVDTPILLQRPQPVSEERRAAMLQPEDVAEMVAAVALLPQRAHVPELIIKPLSQGYC